MEYGKYTGYEFQDVDVWVDVKYTDSNGREWEKTIGGCLVSVISALLDMKDRGIEFDWEVTECFL